MMSPPQGGNGLNLGANWPAFGHSGLFSPPSAGHAGGFAGPSGFSAGLDMGGGMGSAGLGVGGVPAEAGERYSSPGPKNGPGHIPIGIRPSIQAQSAMLRELYPHGPLAAGPAGPLPAP